MVLQPWVMQVHTDFEMSEGHLIFNWDREELEIFFVSPRAMTMCQRTLYFPSENVWIPLVLVHSTYLAAQCSSVIFQTFLVGFHYIETYCHFIRMMKQVANLEITIPSFWKLFHSPHSIMILLQNENGISLCSPMNPDAVYVQLFTCLLASLSLHNDWKMQSKSVTQKVVQREREKDAKLRNRTRHIGSGWVGIWHTVFNKFAHLFAFPVQRSRWWR